MDARRTLVWSARVMAFLVMVLSANAAFAAGALSNLVISGMSPMFDPSVTQYTVPTPANCSVAVTATLTDTTNKLYIQSTLTTSGTVRNAYVCGGKKIDVIVYKNWTEVGRYTVTPVVMVATPPPPPPAALTGLTITGLMPAFSPSVTAYTLQRTASCAVPVTATLTDPTNKLYIANSETASGALRQAWVCDGKTKIDIVIYKVWTEVGRYTVTMVGEMPTDGGSGGDMGGGGGGGGGYVPPPTGPTEVYPTPSPAPVYGEPQPGVEATDVLTAARLLRQGSFGPSTASLASVQANGVNYWIWDQIKNKPASTVADNLDVNALRAAVFSNMATGQDQLRQRMAFALSQTLVVSTNKNVNGYETIPWMKMLYTHAFGNYRTLLREVTLSPSMGKYLDLANSRGVGGASPNENYPREIMQLFTIGIYELNMDGTRKLDGFGQPIPTYTQATVKEVARALTGWTYPTPAGSVYRSTNNENFTGLMEPRPENHDKGSKTFFGVTLPANQSVTKDMDDTLDVLFNHPNMAPFISVRLIRSLVTSNPSPAYVQRVANVFANNGQGVRGDLAAVVTAILTDADAALPGANDGHLQDPILNIIGLGRALDATFGDAGQFMYVLSNLGQAVLTPASVFSFYSPLAPMPNNPQLVGPEFAIYAPAVAIQRANFVYGLLTNQFGSAFSVDLTPYKALAPFPAALVKLIDQKMFQGRMSDALRAVLINSVQSTSDSTNRVLGALYLAALSSEYLVHAQ
jgi:uncharacterized protein (DUF1800 family)